MQTTIPSPSAFARELFAARGIKWRGVCEGCPAGKAPCQFRAQAVDAATGRLYLVDQGGFLAPLEAESDRSMGDAVEALANVLDAFEGQIFVHVPTPTP